MRLGEELSGLPWATISRWAIAAVAAAALAAVVIAVLRSRVGRRGRRLRVEYALLPDPEFETSVEEVIRFAAQMGRARRATGLMHHPDANSIRVRLRSVRDGQLLTSIVMPQEAAAGLRRAMYPDVELRPITEVLDADLEPPGMTLASDGTDRIVESPRTATLYQDQRGEDERPPPAKQPPADGERGPDETQPGDPPRAGAGDGPAEVWVDRDRGDRPGPLHLELR